ncbi:MAG TPA: hypothetical protein DD658_03075 [Deltaproteobacteria bacterium]|nr:hypothetical protein [Deltaproteobacteria bacterium]
MKNNFKTSSPLRVARVSAGLRQRDLAEQVNRSSAYICRLENHGPAVLTPQIAKRISEAVRTPAVFLFGWTR